MVPDLLVGHRSEQNAEDEARRGARERNQRHGNRQAVIDGAHEVDRGVTAETEIDGMAEGQEPGLPQQHIERQREHRGDAHLAQHRMAEIRMEDPADAAAR
jgi:hypothetical protein